MVAGSVCRQEVKVSFVQALPSGDLEALLQQHPEMLMTTGMGRAPSFNMAKLESMELPDAVAAVVSSSRAPVSQNKLMFTRNVHCWCGTDPMDAT
jgi:hypothetical protein